MENDQQHLSTQKVASEIPDSEIKRIFEIQDEQYEFPYHFIPHLDHRGIARRQRSLSWGYEYLCYMEHIARKIADTKPDSVLDVGCGEGRLLNMIGDICPSLTGVDLSIPAIAFAKAFTPKADFRVADAKDVEGTFDAVTAIQVLEHIPDASVSSFLNTLATRVSKTGKVYICVPTTVQPLNPKHYRHYDQNVFESQLKDSKAPLKIVETQFLVADKFLYRTYQKLGQLKTLLDLSFARKMLWSYIWNRLRIASPSDGRHVLFVLQRND